MEGRGPPQREVVIPGDLLDGRGLKPGSGTFNEGGHIYAARVGILSEKDGYVDVIPLGGVYIPRPRDVVIGKITDCGPSHWLVDINSPYPAPLHATETPWMVEFGDTERGVASLLLSHANGLVEHLKAQMAVNSEKVN